MKYTDKQISERLFEMAKDRRFRPLGGVLSLLSLAIERDQIAEHLHWTINLVSGRIAELTEQVFF